MTPYRPEIEQKMKQFYETLSEKDKRRYAGVEAMKFGRGGLAYLNRVLGCSQKTMIKGLKELAALTSETKADPRIRVKGGGRKGYAETHPGLDQKFLAVLKYDTAGDPYGRNGLLDEFTPLGNCPTARGALRAKGQSDGRAEIAPKASLSASQSPQKANSENCGPAKRTI